MTTPEIRVTWLKPEERIEAELQQLSEEGVDAAPIRRAWEDLRRSQPELALLRPEAERLLDDCRNLWNESPAGRNSVDEPSDFEQIIRAAPAHDKSSPLPSSPLPLGERVGVRGSDFLRDRIGGGWVGRMAGCLLGKPVEGVSREGIHAILKSSGRWPLSDYFTAQGVPEDISARYPFNRTAKLTSLKENIVCMPEDDDTNYTMLSLFIFESAGDVFTTGDVATAWLRTMPALRVFTAERVAYQNLLALKQPPETAEFRNPYREWIGAQIRADLWGWVAPANLVRASEYAWRDARLSHVKNGIYGEMYVAAMISHAFATNDLERIIDAGLSVVPASSRLAETIKFVRELAGRVDDYEEAVDQIYERYGSYHWVHTLNNAAIVTAALLFGRGDFERSICYAVQGGFDTDCNGATVGSIVGTLLGRQAIPEKWAAPLQNRVRSSLAGFDNTSIDDLISRTVACVH